jgi:DNA-binding MarR family transcriptional regulator
MGRIHKSLMKNLKPHEFFMLKTLKKLYSKHEKEAQENNLPPSPGVKISELSRESCVSMPGVSQTISTLEKLGYVERITSSSDRRLVFVNLTDAGRKLESDISQSYFKIYDDVATRLGEEDTRALIELLDKLSNAFDQIDHHTSSED